MENETLKMKKKFKELKIQVKLLERLVSQPTVRTDEGSPPETNQRQTSRAGPGKCGACGKSFQRLAQHKSRTKNLDCKNA